jgi:hypothetical protein
MTQTKAHHQRGAHLLLLAALLLYIGSMAVEPLLHAAASAAASADAAVSELDQTDQPAEAEHECSVCKLTRVFSSTAAASPAVAEFASFVPSVVSADLQIRGPPALASSQPRAPPHA